MLPSCNLLFQSPAPTVSVKFFASLNDGSCFGQKQFNDDVSKSIPL